MSDETLKFLGSMIGSFFAAGTALVVMMINLRAQARLESERWKKAQNDERDRWERARSDDHEKWRRGQVEVRRIAVRAAAAEVGKQLAMGAHAICWLTWDVEEHPEHMTAERIKSYEEEIHRLLSDLLASTTTLAALDIERYRQLRPAVQRFYALDRQMGDAGRLLKTSPEESGALFTRCYDEGAAFESELPELLAEALKELNAPEARTVAPVAS